MKGEFMKESKDIEKILLNDAKYEALVKLKIEKEFIKEISKNQPKNKEITDIKKAPKNRLFTKYATYLVMNKNSKTKSYINGVQAEGFLGTQNSAREKLLKGETDSFVNGNNFIKFVKVKV